MADAHTYRIAARWSGADNGRLEVEEIETPIPFSVPVEFGGPPGFWTPEHLLLSAVASCFVTTFQAIAQFSKFQFDRLEITAEGTIGKGQGGWQFTSITLRPKLNVQREDDRDRGLRLLQKAERSCLVSRSLSVKVEFVAAVEVGGRPSLVAEEDPAVVAG